MRRFALMKMIIYEKFNSWFATNINDNAYNIMIRAVSSF